MEIDKNKPIVVTGATGYLASWIVKYLLDDGYSVHCCVRSPDDEAKIAHLQDLTQDKSKIRFFKTDLLEEGSYQEAIEGCELIIHTASPFFYDLKKDPQKELIEPALNGTRNILESANKSSSIKRVVLTSSIASIFGDCVDAAQKDNFTFNENDWNTTSSLTHAPYSFSKLQAEKEAWKMVAEQDQWDLVVINPSWIIGPAIKKDAQYESKKIFKQFCDGTMMLGCPDINLAIVDVRDVARAHINAGFDSSMSGRNIVSAENCNLLDIGKTLRKKVGGLLFPRLHLPKPALWLFAPLANFTREYVSKNVGHQLKIDNSKSLETGLIKYRSYEETITDYYYHLYPKRK